MWIIRVLVLSLVLSPAAALGAVEDVAVVSTPSGEIVWRFFPDAAPGHAAYVKELIGRRFYDGTTLHRVIPHFVVQGGDPNSKDADRTNDGDGEADRRLKAEFSKELHYRPGTVGMARDADPDSGSCQFFIALTDLPRLDGRYTIFGEVISGLDIAQQIAERPRDLNDNPLERIAVTVRLEKRKVPETALSRTAASASGELLTGPDKPRPFDANDNLWKLPSLLEPGAGKLSAVRLDVSIDAAGRVIDARFPKLETQHADTLRLAVLDWRFAPALYDGKPQKARFEIDSDGARIGPPGGGAPVEIAPPIVGPRVAPRVPLEKGKTAPAKPPLLRLTIDAAGTVTSAALQRSCGDAALDLAALAAAKGLRFAPATRPAVKGDPEPIAVYLNVEAVFDAAP